MIRVADIKAGDRFDQLSGTVIACEGCGVLLIAREGARACSPRCKARVRRADEKKAEDVEASRIP